MHNKARIGLVPSQQEKRSVRRKTFSKEWADLCLQLTDNKKVWQSISLEVHSVQRTFISLPVSV
ncbi:hypothetical protein BDE02_03G155500 [Populus trichocarpa]|nr:hypothetical protein BDE02_03G155500 [Populus trichocarpa]